VLICVLGMVGGR